MEINNKELLLFFAALDEVLHHKKVIYEHIDGKVGKWFAGELEKSYGNLLEKGEEFILQDMQVLYDKVLKEVGVE